MPASDSDTIGNVSSLGAPQDSSVSDADISGTGMR